MFHREKTYGFYTPEWIKMEPEIKSPEKGDLEGVPQPDP